jgi:hypothetical protein
MKRILIGIIAVIMGLSMVACNKNEEKGSSSQLSSDSSLAQVESVSKDGVYTSEYGYSVKLPVGWSKVTIANFMEAFTDGAGNSMSFISGPTDDIFKSADEEYFKTEHFAGMGDSVEFIKYKAVEISGNKGHEVVLTSKKDDVVTYVTQILLGVGEEIYVFTFTDIEGENQETIDGLISSLAIN